MSTTGSAVDALQRELIKVGKKKAGGRPRKDVTKKVLAKLERRLKS